MVLINPSDEAVSTEVSIQPRGGWGRVSHTERKRQGLERRGPDRGWRGGEILGPGVFLEPHSVAGSLHQYHRRLGLPVGTKWKKLLEPSYLVEGRECRMWGMRGVCARGVEPGRRVAEEADCEPPG